MTSPGARAFPLLDIEKFDHDAVLIGRALVWMQVDLFDANTSLTGDRLMHERIDHDVFATDGEAPDSVGIDGP